MLKSKITRLLLKYDVEIDYAGTDLMEFYIEGVYHAIEFQSPYEGILQIGEGSHREEEQIHDDNFRDLIENLF